jgi:hypothetical protein
MSQEAKHGSWRRPSPALVVALIALVLSMSGTAVAASKLVNGDKLIKKQTLSGNRLRNQTLTGKQLASGAVGTAKVGALPGARVRNSTNESIPTNNSVPLTFDTEDFDVGDVHSTAANTSRLTAPVAGKYLIVASARWADNTTGHRTLTIKVDGGTQIALDAVSAYSSTGFALAQTVETVYHLAAGQYVEVWAWQNSGDVLDVQSLPECTPVLSMSWIAP